MLVSYIMVAYFPNILVLPPSSVHFSMTGTLSLNVVLFASVGLPDSIIVLPSGRSAIVVFFMHSMVVARIIDRSFIFFTISQIPNTVNLRRLFSFIRHKIKIVIIFIICRMMCATYFLPRVHIYLWEKSVSIGEFGVNFRGVNSVNFWNI